MSEIKTIGFGWEAALERLGQALAPNGDWTMANAAAAEDDKRVRIEQAKGAWLNFVKRGGLERVVEEITKSESKSSPEHKRFITEYLRGFEDVFNRKAPGMFVSGGTGIGKTYNAVLYCKNAMWSPDFTKSAKTEWAGKRYEHRVPATCFYATSARLLDRLSDWKNESKDAVFAEVRAADIAVIDDVGFPSELGKRNGEVFLINEILRTKPRGLILQTRLAMPAFEELFGESCADIVRRFAMPCTFGCKSRRTWGAA